MKTEISKYLFSAVLMTQEKLDEALNPVNMLASH